MSTSSNESKALRAVDGVLALRSSQDKSVATWSA